MVLGGERVAVIRPIEIDDGGLARLFISRKLSNKPLADAEAFAAKSPNYPLC
jgi:hypothetical protein